MKLTVIAILLISILGGGLRTISRINEYAREGAKAYAQQDYTTAISAYAYLLNDLEVQDDQLRLNLAHSYYQSGQLAEAQHEYRLLADHPTQRMRAIVHLQLGNIATKQRKYKQALSLYKQALIADPGSDAARYNYELLKKYLDLHPEKAEEAPKEQLPPPAPEQEDSVKAPQPEQEQEQQPKKKPDSEGDQEAEVDQPQPDAQGQQQAPGGSSPEQQKNEQAQAREKEQASGKEKGDTEGLNREDQFDPTSSQRSGGYEPISDQDQRAQTQRARLQQVNLSPEKARILLDAMRNAELQYIQQLPKKATKKPDRSKPDW
ncbi:MAG: tetratricopeptide repeat protein [Hymenobacteraceae bacterium]|nr:tetratricopeptide repeat protein [Hymenobacteraceae bacterium]